LNFGKKLQARESWQESAKTAQKNSEMLKRSPKLEKGDVQTLERSSKLEKVEEK
jgi:hypothetical protein